MKIHPQASKHLQTDEETKQHIIQCDSIILQNRDVWGRKRFEGFAAAVYISCTWVWRSNASVHARTRLSLCFWSEIWGQFNTVLCLRCPETSSYLPSGGWNVCVCQTVWLLTCLALQSHRKGLGLTDLLALSSSCLSSFEEGGASVFISPPCERGRTAFGLSLDRLLSLSALNGDISLVLMGDSGALGLNLWCWEKGGGLMGPTPGWLGTHPVRVIASVPCALELGGFKTTCDLWWLCCLDLPLLSCLFLSPSLSFSPSTSSSSSFISLGLSLLFCLVIIWILLWRRAPPMP